MPVGLKRARFTDARQRPRGAEIPADEPRRRRDGRGCGSGGKKIIDIGRTADIVSHFSGKKVLRRKGKTIRQISPSTRKQEINCLQAKHVVGARRRRAADAASGEVRATSSADSSAVSHADNNIATQPTREEARRRGGEAARRRGGEVARRRDGEVERRRGDEAARKRGSRTGGTETRLRI